MTSRVGSIFRRLFRRPDEPLEILLFIGFPQTDSLLCQTGHRFYGLGPAWPVKELVQPDNLWLLPGNSIPPDLELDLVICPHGVAAMEQAFRTARNLHLPLVDVYTFLPAVEWSEAQVKQICASQGEYQIFPSLEHRDAWFCPEGKVIPFEDVVGWCSFLEEAASSPYLGNF